jgi:hypothetical protein
MLGVDGVRAEFLLPTRIARAEDGRRRWGENPEILEEVSRWVMSAAEEAGLGTEMTPNVNAHAKTRAVRPFAPAARA